jgi:SPP1 family predicted phage head-tail adaptor
VSLNAAELVHTFRKRVTIQNKSTVSDGQGGQTETWNNGSTVWASIEPLKAYERYQAMQMQVPVTHKVTMRYTDEITSASRLLYGDRVFWVKEIIDPEERQRFLVLKAIERATA